MPEVVFGVVLSLSPMPGMMRPAADRLRGWRWRVPNSVMVCAPFIDRNSKQTLQISPSRHGLNSGEPWLHPIYLLSSPTASKSWASTSGALELRPAVLSAVPGGLR